MIPIRRMSDASAINTIVNHESVRPSIGRLVDGKVDLTAAVADPRNICLAGERGALLFMMLQPALYDVHMAILPEGRGEWCLGFTHACLHWLFTRTPAVEAVARIPAGSLAATALVHAIHGEWEFQVIMPWGTDGAVIPVRVWSLSVQQWTRFAPDLVEHGRWLSRRIKKELHRSGHKLSFIDNIVADRYAGGLVDMLQGGQPQKAVVLYNRWASMANYAPIAIVSADPPTIDLGGVLLIFRGTDVVVIPCLPQSQQQV